MIGKKLQIFISSTYTDLKEERELAVEAILDAGHIPAGMELFKAGKSQMNTIRKWIDSSDVYMLILGGRYGSIEDETGLSYTQLEYEYALSKNIPVFSIVLDDKLLHAKMAAGMIDIFEKENRSKYDSFKELVMKKIVKIIERPLFIKEAIHATLNAMLIDDDYHFIGWTRSNSKISYNLQDYQNTGVKIGIEGYEELFTNGSSIGREILKRECISGANELCLHARTGFSFIDQNGVVHAFVKEILNNGKKFNVIIQNPWSFNAFYLALNEESFQSRTLYQKYLSGKIDSETLFTIYQNSQWYIKRIKPCQEGYMELRKEYGDLIQLKYSDRDMTNSILLSDKYLFFEPSLNIMKFGHKTLPLFEIRANSQSELYKDCKNYFNAIWATSISFNTYKKKEAYYKQRLRSYWDHRC